MSDTLPDRAVRAFEAHDAFERDGDGFAVTTTTFDGWVTAEPTDGAPYYTLEVRAPVVGVVGGHAAVERRRRHREAVAVPLEGLVSLEGPDGTLRQVVGHRERIGATGSKARREAAAPCLLTRAGRSAGVGRDLERGRPLAQRGRASPAREAS